MIAFGPVPSRRLGQSLGVNNIPPKACPYSCIYCQVGRTDRLQIEREAFHAPSEVFDAVHNHLEALHACGERVDYLTIVPDGEPTLDSRLGETIDRLRTLGTKIAVMTNGALLSRREVRAALAGADWVSIKVDAVDAAVWREVNRPSRALMLRDVLEGMLAFADDYQGRLASETMLVAGVNDAPEMVTCTADFVCRLAPHVAYLTVPTRPPAEPNVRVPDEEALARAYAIFDGRVGRVELLMRYEGDAFGAVGDPARALLGITAVHPMRMDAVRVFLARAGTDESTVDRLVAAGRVMKTVYEGHEFLMRTHSRRGTPRGGVEGNSPH